MALIEDARAALDGVQDDPARTRRIAADLLASDDCPPGARAVALWALGRAHHELGDVASACDVLTQAAHAARAQREPTTEAQVLMSLSLSLFAAGRSLEAFGALEAATAELTGTEHARAVMQRGLLEFHQGRWSDAVKSFDDALPELRDGDDRMAQARLLVNRAAATTSLGRLADAEADLVEAASIADQIGQKMIAAAAEHNLGFLYARRGDVPLALEVFERARAAYAQIDDPARLVAVLEADRCEVLLSAGLHHEAVEASAAAASTMAAFGNEVDLAEAELLLARSQLAAGNLPAARRAADRAAGRFSHSGREAWASLAAFVSIQARVLAATDDTRPAPSLLPATRALAERLTDCGWEVEALHVRGFAARVALALDQPHEARKDLRLAAEALHRGPATSRVQAWYAAALLCHLNGDRPGTRRALAGGLDVVDELRSTLGGTELRASVSALGTDITELGMAVELGARRPRAVLGWAERTRALALADAPARPPDDEVFAAALAELRRRRDEARRVTAAGGDATDATAGLVALERTVRDQARRAQGRGDVERRAAGAPDLGSLEHRVLVELLESRGRLYAVTARDGEVEVHDLGATDGVEQHLDSLLFSLHRLARGVGSSASRELAARTLAEVGQRLSDHLLGPLHDRIADRPVVVVPSALLARTPWATLPHLAGRPVAVSPSLAAHARAVGHRERDGGPRPAGGVLLVAGPGLPGADDEVGQLAALHPGATVLQGADATADLVRQALESASLAHLACHGRFRSDNALFSSLQLADGDLTVYELEQLGSVPRTLVLSACDSARNAVVAGAEVLGMSSALLSSGCATVVAPVSPVSDRGTTPVMVELHRRLLAGDDVVSALAAARPAEAATSEAVASWQSFAVFGAG